MTSIFRTNNLPHVNLISEGKREVPSVDLAVSRIGTCQKELALCVTMTDGVLVDYRRGRNLAPRRSSAARREFDLSVSRLKSPTPIKLPNYGLPYVSWIARSVVNKRPEQVSAQADPSVGRIAVKTAASKQPYSVSGTPQGSR